MMIELIRRYSDYCRLVSYGGVEVAKRMSNYGLVATKLTGASYLEALQYASGLVRSRNVAEIAKLSEAGYRAQVEILREHTDSLVDLHRAILAGATRPFMGAFIAHSPMLFL
jgi:hypothetical protein